MHGLSSKYKMSPVVEFSTIVEMFNRLTEFFLKSERPALLYKSGSQHRSMSYDELRSRADSFALGLVAIGVSRGERVALLSENRPEWVIADMAMAKLGIVTVSIYSTLTARQVEHILRDSGAVGIVVSNQFQQNKVLTILPQLPSLRYVIVMADQNVGTDSKIYSFKQVSEMGKQFGKEHPEALFHEEQKTKPDDLLTLIYTSGTTGLPKGVMLTHRNLVSNMYTAAACIPFSEGDLLSSYLPLSHSYQRMGGYYTAMSCGATLSLAESIESFRETVMKVRPTVVTTVPRLFERLYNRLMRQVNESTPLRKRIFEWSIRTGRKYRRSRSNGNISLPLYFRNWIADLLVFRKIRARMGGRIKFFVSGGAALAAELGEFFDAMGILIFEGYGLTETSPVISVNRPDANKFGTVGKPLPGVDVRIAEDGEILVRGSNVMLGYWNDKKATDEMIDADGWLHTGDIGAIDSDGFLKITDRKKHLFVSSGGKNIAPQPIEDLFMQSSLIDQFVLIGDGRMYLTALVVPEYEALKSYADRNGITYEHVEDLAGKKEIWDLFDTEFGRIQQHLANYERVRKFTILKKPLSIEGDEITPTLKVRRKVVEENFKDIIESMYEGMA